MDFDEHALADLQKIIARQLGQAVTNVEVISADVDEEHREIRLVVAIETEARAEDLADGYFGLTGVVREALGDKWRGFFPIITPQFGMGKHA